MLIGSGAVRLRPAPELIPARHSRHLAVSASEDDERGASATEYGLLAVAIAALIVIVVFALGGVVDDMFSNSCSSIQASTGTDAACG